MASERVRGVGASLSGRQANAERAAWARRREAAAPCHVHAHTPAGGGGDPVRRCHRCWPMDSRWLFELLDSLGNRRFDAVACQLVEPPALTLGLQTLGASLEREADAAADQIAAAVGGRRGPLGGHARRRHPRPLVAEHRSKQPICCHNPSQPTPWPGPSRPRATLQAPAFAAIDRMEALRPMPRHSPIRRRIAASWPPRPPGSLDHADLAPTTHASTAPPGRAGRCARSGPCPSDRRAPGGLISGPLRRCSAKTGRTYQPYLMHNPHFMHQPAGSHGPGCRRPFGDRSPDNLEHVVPAAATSMDTVSVRVSDDLSRCRGLSVHSRA
jgi:hypothetical protein